MGTFFTTEPNVMDNTNDQKVYEAIDEEKKKYDDVIMNIQDENWGEWHTKNLFDEEFSTTAIIEWRLSAETYTAKVTTDPDYFEKRYASDPWGYSDDEDMDTEPKKVRLVLTEYEYHRINLKITPQIGFHAGLQQIYTFIEPGTYIDHTTKKNRFSEYWKDSDPVPTLNTLIKDVMYNAHYLEYGVHDTILISDLNKKHIEIPLILSDNLFLRLLEVKDIPSIIGHIIRRYLGITQMSFNFIPNNIFEPLIIDIIPNMRKIEIECLIVTFLFVKYREKNIKSVPKFIWMYNENGICKKSEYNNYDMNETEYLLIFDGVKCDNYGLKTQLNGCNKCVILNIVGHGFKTIYFDSFTNITFKDLVKEFYNYTNRDYDEHNQNKEIIAIYSYHAVGSRLGVFYPNTYDHGGQISSKFPVYPCKQNKRFITFDYSKYQKILNWSLEDLNINKNGCLIEMYCVTGPCIKLMFCSQVGDQRVMDVNFNWSLDVFKMYVSKLECTKFSNNCIDRKIEHCSNENSLTLHDICKDFDVNHKYGINGNIVYLR